MKQFIYLLILASSLFASTNFDLKEWYTYYYLNPQPNKFVQAIQQLSNEKRLVRNKVLPRFSSFFSEVMNRNQQSLNQWINIIKRLNEKERQVFIVALYYSNVDNKFKYIEKIILTEKEKALVGKLKKRRFTKIIDMPILNITKLDMHWAAFKASGNEQYIIKILDTLQYLNNRDSRFFAVGRSAKWSLTSNVRLHKKVMNTSHKYLKNIKNKSSIEYQTLFQILYGIKRD